MAKLEKQSLGESLLLGALILSILGNYLRGTQVPVEFSWLSPLVLFRISQLGVLLASLKIFLVDETSFKFKGSILLVSLFLYYVGSNAHLLDAFFYFIVLVAARNYDYRRMLWIYIIEAAVIMFSLAIITLSGLLVDMTMVRPGATLRSSFGSVTPSDFAAHVFHILLAYFIYRNFRLTKWEYLGSILVTFLTFHYTGTRLDFILMVLVNIIGVSYAKLTKLIIKLNSGRLIGLMIGYLGINILFTYAFNPAWTWFRYLDDLLSHRLTYGKMALEQPLSLFGQFIRENGNGKFDPHRPYFFIDSSIVRLLVMQGIVFFILFILFLAYLIRKEFRQRNYGIIVGLGLVLLSGAIDHHLWEISYNFIFLATLAKTNDFEQKI